MSNEFDIDEEDVLEKIESDLILFGKARENLIPILQMIQEKYGFLPPESLATVARYLNISPCEVNGVATFYNQFRFHPPGKHPIKVCLGTACHVRGGDIILENFERKLEIKEGETTPDREFSIDRVACVGCCALAPVALVGDEIEDHMAPSKVEGIITKIRVKKEIEDKKRLKS